MTNPSQGASNPQEAMFNEAKAAIQKGDRARAKDLLTRLLKVGQDNPIYWIWMSTVVDTPKERIYCLKQANRLDPKNTQVKRGLAVLGAEPPDRTLAVPGRLQHRNWRPELPEAEQRPAVSLPRAQIAIMGLALLIVVGLVAGAVWGPGKNLIPKRRSGPLIIRPTYTAVSGVAVTNQGSVQTTPGAKAQGISLAQTYTPTPLYVNTPHPVSEAYRIGQRAYLRGDWPAAEDYFRQVATSEPGAYDVVYYLAETYRMQEKYAQAQELYTEIIREDAEFAPAYVGRARVYLAQNPETMGEEAVLMLEQAIAADDRYGEAYLELGAALVKMGEFEQAMDTLDEAAVLLPGSPLVHLYRAEAYRAAGDFRQALESALQANTLDITLIPAYRIMGEAMQQEGDLSGSIQPLVTYAGYEPDDSQVFAWLARAYLVKGDKKEALAALDRSLRLDNQQGEAYLLRAALRMEQDDADGGLEDYRAAARFNPESFEASMGIGKALMALGYPGDAYMQFERTVSLANSETQKAEHLYWRAQSLEELDELTAALRDWEALLELPTEAVPGEWMKQAQQRVAELYALTPTLLPKTATATITAAATRQPAQSKTPAPTPTRKPTLAPSPTKRP